MVTPSKGGMDYEITRYNPSHRQQVLDVLPLLWGNERAQNEAYFKWKYEENPYADSPLGIVALREGNVVGFRGYFASEWHIASSGMTIRMLHPGDTVVHPDHRRRNLSVLMGNFATEQFREGYRIFFNLSAAGNSTPGYLKLGFHPLQDKVYWRRFDPVGLAKFALAEKTGHRLMAPRIDFGEQGPVIVSTKPHPQAMLAISSAQTTTGRLLAQRKDIRFFQWRFDNPRSNYVFYLTTHREAFTGYLVMRMSPSLHGGYVIDYAESETGAIERILTHIIDQNHFDVLSIYSFCLPPNLPEVLQKLGFKSHAWLQMITSTPKAVYPLLLRPLIPPSRDADWIIDGLDIRRIESWEIREISSDSV